jgi:hypothetical protein
MLNSLIKESFLFLKKKVLIKLFIIKYSSFSSYSNTYLNLNMYELQVNKREHKNIIIPIYIHWPLMASTKKKTWNRVILYTIVYSCVLHLRRLWDCFTSVNICNRLLCSSCGRIICVSNHLGWVFRKSSETALRQTSLWWNEEGRESKTASVGVLRGWGPRPGPHTAIQALCTELYPSPSLLFYCVLCCKWIHCGTCKSIPSGDS